MRDRGEDFTGDTPGGMDLDGLDAILGLHVGLAHTLILQHFNRSLSHVGLTPKQTATLWLVAANPGLPQVDIARFFHMDRATMLGITNSLTDHGLLDRGASIRTRRTVGLHITPAGTDKLAAAKAAVAAHEVWVKSNLAPEEAAFLIHLLKRLNGPRGCEAADEGAEAVEVLG